MKMYGEKEVNHHAFIPQALSGNEWSDSRPLHLYLWRSPPYPYCRRLSGPQSRSGRCREENYFLPLWEVEHWFLRRPFRNPLLYRSMYKKNTPWF
jgi:hypothetical protein